MNAFEEAKDEVRKETMLYVFKKLADKETNLISKSTLKYALYAYDMPKLSDDKVMDEMLGYLGESSPKQQKLNLDDCLEDPKGDLSKQETKRPQEEVKAPRRKKMVVESDSDGFQNEDRNSQEEEESEEEDGIDFEHFKRIFNRY